MNRMRELRNIKAVTMKEVGDYLGVTETSVSYYETGKREPDPKTLCKLADYYGVSIDYLLCRDEEKAPTNVDAKKIQEILEAMKEAGMSDEKIKNITKEDIKLIAGIANEIVKNRKE